MPEELCIEVCNIVQEAVIIQSAKTRLGADCGSDHELLIAKFRLKLKKVWKTTKPFRYDLNQIPYNYTVEMTNRFKGLDLIECLKNNAWMFVTLYKNWTWNNRQVPNRKRSMSRLYIDTLLI